MALSQRGGSGPVFQHGLAETSLAVDELIAKPAPVTQEVAVHFVVVAVDDAAQGSIALAGIRAPPQSTMPANQGTKLLVPLPTVMVLQGLSVEPTSRPDFHQVAP